MFFKKSCGLLNNFQYIRLIKRKSNYNSDIWLDTSRESGWLVFINITTSEAPLH